MSFIGKRKESRQSEEVALNGVTSPANSKTNYPTLILKSEC